MEGAGPLQLWVLAALALICVLTTRGAAHSSRSPPLTAGPSSARHLPTRTLMHRNNRISMSRPSIGVGSALCDRPAADSECARQSLSRGLRAAAFAFSRRRRRRTRHAQSPPLQWGGSTRHVRMSWMLSDVGPTLALVAAYTHPAAAPFLDPASLNDGHPEPHNLPHPPSSLDETKKEGAFFYTMVAPHLMYDPSVKNDSRHTNPLKGQPRRAREARVGGAGDPPRAQPWARDKREKTGWKERYFASPRLPLPSAILGV